MRAAHALLAATAMLALLASAHAEPFFSSSDEAPHAEEDHEEFYSQPLEDGLPPSPDPPRLLELAFADRVDVQHNSALSIRMVVVAPNGLHEAYGYNNIPSQLNFIAPDGRGLQAFVLPGINQIEGVDTRATYVTDLHVPQWNFPDGEYRLQYVLIVDRYGKQTYFDANTMSSSYSTRFLVTGQRVDTEAPLLTYVMLPRAVPMGGDGKTLEPLLMDVCFKSGPAGLIPNANGDLQAPSSSFVQVESQNAPAPQVLTHHFDPSDVTVAPAKPDVTCARLNITMPHYAWPGAWRVRLLRLCDAAGNDALWSTADLQKYRFETHFYVENFNQTYLAFDLFDYLPSHKLVDDYYYDYYEDDGYGYGY
eukprot:m.102986 g.102986  ORF g.102986 m.102986 type:complete len:364 (-) comp8839_c1_seq1:303-1394(-)